MKLPRVESRVFLGQRSLPQLLSGYFPLLAGEIIESIAVRKHFLSWIVNGWENNR